MALLLLPLPRPSRLWPYAPVIDLKPMFCSAVIFATGAAPLSRISFAEYHTEAYVMAGRTTAVYTCLALLSVALHVEPAILVRAIV